MQVVNVCDLKKNYSGEQALDGVTFSVDTGKLFGIIGADGAGKTTLMRILVTLLNPDSGEAHILNYNVVNNVRTIREKIGYMPQRFSLYGDLSVKENLSFFADVFNISGKERKTRMAKLLQFSRLAKFQKRRASNLSGGMKQKLALSCALIHSPKLLILDEPTTGVDPVSRREFWEILKDLRNDGVTIIVSTPYMDEAAMCDELLIMHNGKVLKNGTPSGLVGDYPYDLYKIENEDKTVTCSNRVTLPSPVIQMYPSGGAVHVAVKKDFQLDTQLQNQLLASIEDAKDIKTVKPDIEDHFFMLIAENGNQKTNNNIQKA